MINATETYILIKDEAYDGDDQDPLFVVSLFIDGDELEPDDNNAFDTIEEAEALAKRWMLATGIRIQRDL